MLPCCRRQPERQSWALPIRLAPSLCTKSAAVLEAKQLLRSPLAAWEPNTSGCPISAKATCNQWQAWR